MEMISFRNENSFSTAKGFHWCYGKVEIETHFEKDSIPKGKNACNYAPDYLIFAEKSFIDVWDFEVEHLWSKLRLNFV